MDNPARTAAFIAHRDARREHLRESLTTLLAGRTKFTFEIGAGHGHYLTDYAKAHTATFCLGIDLLKDRVERANRKRDRAGLINLSFVQAEAEECVAALPEGCQFERILILFPDPWPKRRHHKNRIMQPAFLSTLATRSPKGTHLCFRTDDASYFAAAKTVVAGHADWAVSNEPWPYERETVFQSRAEAFQSLVAIRK